MKKIIFNLLIWIIILITAVALRLGISTTGHNFDSESWFEVANVMLDGRVVYNTTSRYNYGPLWAYILSGLAHLSLYLDSFNVTGFHFIIACFLSLVDILISWIIYKLYGKFPAILYLLSPISVLLTGYHSQFDNFAVFLGLSGWYLLGKYLNQPQKRYFIASAFLFGLSLVAKHVLFMFPIWILFMKYHPKFSFPKKFIYIAFIYFMFLGSFGIEIYRDYDHKTQVITGIKEYVFKYKSSYGYSVGMELINLAFPKTLIHEIFNNTPVFKGYTFFYVLVLTFYGYIYVRRNKNSKNIFPVYLLAFTALTPSLADQYFAIALVPIAVYWKYLASIIFNVVGFTYLASGNSANITNVYPYSFEIGLNNNIFKIFPWYTTTNLINYQPQMWLLILAVQLLVSSKLREETL